MPARYAYSLNGENYTGAFATRDLALAAAFEAARDPMNTAPPQTVYIGRRVEADPHAAGHAKTLLREMAWQAHDEVGAPAASYLHQLPEDKIKDLDVALEKVLYEWLRRHDLLPTYFKVEGMSEHPVPQPPAIADNKSSELNEPCEVTEIGLARDRGI